MIERDICKELSLLIGEYPIVSVLGPRQSGKTTLVRHYLPEYAYRNLEVPDDRLFAIEDPRGFLQEAGQPLILDEIQRAPELLSYLQVLVDESGENGRYVLTGSHQLALREAISQSLAGRTAVLSLLPLSIEELAKSGTQFDRYTEYLWRGFLPRVYDQNQRPQIAYQNYFKTYVERDVRQLVQLRDVAVFEKFLRLLAGRTGQLINMVSLGNDTGVDSKTIKNWLSVLEASFIVFRLPPYYENIGKRLVKSPKYYFYEPGLLTYLLDIDAQTQLARDPLIGAMFENLVIVEAMKFFSNRGRQTPLYFYRDNHGQEIDLLFKRGGRTTGIEIKSAATINSKIEKKLSNFSESVLPLDQKALIYGGEQSRGWSSGVVALPFSRISEVLNPD